MSERADNLSLWTGTLVSISLHALVASVLIVLPPVKPGTSKTIGAGTGEREVILFDPQTLPPDEPMVEREPPKVETSEQTPPPMIVTQAPKPLLVMVPPPEPKLLSLGVDADRPKSDSWIENKSDQELSAMESKVNQPALSQRGGNPGQLGRPGDPGSSSASQAQDAPGVSLPKASEVEPSRAPIDLSVPSASPAPGSDSPEAKPGEKTELPVGPKAIEGPTTSKPLPEGPEPKGPSAELPREKVDGEARPESDQRQANSDKSAPGTPSTSDGRDKQNQSAQSAGNKPGEKPATPVAPMTAASEKVAPRAIDPLERAAAPAPAQRPAPAMASPSVNDEQTKNGAVKMKPTSSAPNGASPTTPASAPSVPGTPDAGTLGDGRGDASDRDSDASVVSRKAKYFRNGRVEAGEGLEIKTVRPQFTLFAQAFAIPRNPVIEILFGKDGRVRSVKVMRSSGYPSEVDETIVTAAYNWRASGKALTELSERPDAGIKLVITILLSPE